MTHAMTQTIPSALRRFASRLLLGLTLVAPAMAAPTLAAAPTPLVSADWLKQHLRDPGLVVLDIRSAIDGGGVKAYEAAHIPGSVHSDYDKAGWRVERNKVPFMLPTVAELEKLIGELGIDEETRVVVVPDIAGYDTFYKKLIATVPLKNVTSRFAMERIKSTTALPIVEPRQ